MKVFYGQHAMKFTATYSPDSNKLRITAALRLDAATYERVKAAGFRWAPKLDQFIAPMWTPDRAALCIELAGQIDDDDSSLMERAEDRAERFDDYQGKRASEAARALDHVHSITSGIPLGQPILVGHHSERHARRDAERIENGMRKAVQLFDTSEYWKRRAASAIAHAKYKERADVRHRRIKGLEADQRKHQKDHDAAEQFARLWGTVDGGTGWKPLPDGTESTMLQRCLTLANMSHAGACDFGLWGDIKDGKTTPEEARDRALESCERRRVWARQWLDHIANRLEYERAMLGESGGIVAAQFDLRPGGTITHRGRQSVILRLNKRDGKILSVTVTGQGWTVGVEEIKAYEPPSEEASAAVAVVMKKAQICNYPGPGFVHITRAQWDAISNDYKGTRDMGAGIDATQGGRRFDTLRDYRDGSEVHDRHRVRTAMGAVLRNHVGPDVWAAKVAASGAMHEKATNTAHGLHPVYITDAKVTEPARVDAPAKAPRKSMARKVAEAAGVDTAGAPDVAPAPALHESKAEARAVLAELTAPTRPTTPPATQSDATPTATQSGADFEALRQSLKAGVQVVSAPQLFPTPPDLAARMVELAEIEPGMRVLEPSAGTGRIIDAIAGSVPLDSIHLHACELNSHLAHVLRATRPSVMMHVCDFLEMNAAYMATAVDRIIMNPPFANGADVDHVTHAMQFLKPGGRLVAVMSAGVTFRDDKRTRAFRAMVERNSGTIEPLPADTFASSGTGVNTVLVVLDARATVEEESKAMDHAVIAGT